MLRQRGGNPELAHLNRKEVTTKCIVLLYKSCFHSLEDVRTTWLYVWHSDIGFTERTDTFSKRIHKQTFSETNKQQM